MIEDIDHVTCEHTYQSWYWCYTCRFWFVGYAPAEAHARAEKHMVKQAPNRRNYFCQTGTAIVMGPVPQIDIA